MTSVASCALLAAACSSSGPAAQDSQNVVEDAVRPRICTAVRGNGDRIFAHLGSLARVVEEYGLLHGSAGGSSGSITTFVSESIHLNPLIRRCGECSCSNREAGARAALLYKATQGYFEALTASDEVLAFSALKPLVDRIAEANLDGIGVDEVETAREALETILESPDLRDVVNPEMVDLLRNSPNPAYHVRDLVEMAQSFGSFDAVDPSILIRPGLVDFEAAGAKVGRVGSFFAGYEPVDLEGMAGFLDACAMPSRGMNWPEASQLSAGTVSCGDLLRQLVVDFRRQVRSGDFPSRIDDPVGHEGFRSLVATSVITGDSVGNCEAARADYLAAREWSLDIDFADVRFGFFGTDRDLNRIATNPMRYDDLKTDKFIALRSATWRNALTYSPAEPGIARALELGDGMVSAGGWPDLHPVLALKNMGCDEVVYITRNGEESQFALGMARLMNASPQRIDALYSLEDSTSAFSRSLQEADATWCTSWGDFSGFDVAGITSDAYNAAIVSDDPFFRFCGYPRVEAPSQAPLGCGASLE
ncbi:MAG: hypothetical protein AAGA56_07605 [Myxococcota bacterium]